MYMHNLPFKLQRGFSLDTVTSLLWVPAEWVKYFFGQQFKELP
jgi:hypothetical protein